MALWRDPLDELIADLERTLPPGTGPRVSDLPSLEGMQFCVHAILAGTPEAWAVAMQDPRARRMWSGAGGSPTLLGLLDPDGRNKQADRRSWRGKRNSVTMPERAQQGDRDQIAVGTEDSSDQR